MSIKRQVVVTANVAQIVMPTTHNSNGVYQAHLVVKIHSAHTQFVVMLVVAVLHRMLV